ncbi:winged helix-turn-helix transcriptional regulator [Mollicutes bacterium LVI A0039]|nr:winged helix-turn-helix transcriptional regulator [Mollicutes bacterium LVI A0039]
MEKCNIMDCDVYHAIKIIKSRYASVFIFSLDEGAKTFTQIETEFDFVSSVQVVRTLKHLIEYKIVVQDEGQYKLTKAGSELVPILDSLETWYEQFN